jgi:predicted nuclease with TOPRIM domain
MPRTLTQPPLHIPDDAGALMALIDLEASRYVLLREENTKLKKSFDQSQEATQGWLKEFDRLKGFEAENKQLKHWKSCAENELSELTHELTKLREEYERICNALEFCLTTPGMIKGRDAATQLLKGGQ